MDINTHLPAVLLNLENNLKQMTAQLAAAEHALSQLAENEVAAIKVLLDKFEHPQAIAQFVNAAAQKTGLDKMVGEVSTAIAVLQTSIDDEGFKKQATAQLEANLKNAKNPLPVAGQSGQPPAADPNAGAAAPVAAPAA